MISRTRADYCESLAGDLVLRGMILPAFAVENFWREVEAILKKDGIE